MKFSIRVQAEKMFGIETRTQQETLSLIVHRYMEKDLEKI